MVYRNLLEQEQNLSVVVKFDHVELDYAVQVEHFQENPLTMALPSIFVKFHLLADKIIQELNLLGVTTFEVSLVAINDFEPNRPEKLVENRIHFSLVESLFPQTVVYSFFTHTRSTCH